jgi:L-amino acid N-acyltransferase YncA
MDVVVRSATPEDAEAIAGILNTIIAARIYTAFDTPFSAEAERDYLLNFPARGVFHVAARAADGCVVGFQNLERLATFTHAFDHVGSLGTFVDLGHRRQGIARRLFDATFHAAVRKGFEKVFTYVRADNPAALQTYLSQGFRIVGTAARHARIDGRYVDEIVIEKLLLEDRRSEAGS